MKIYIEFFSSLPTKKQKFHGGGNYGHAVVEMLCNINNSNFEIVLLCPEWFEPSLENEPILFRKEIIWERVEKFSSKYPYEKNSIVYFPVLYQYNDFNIMYSLKKKRPDLKLCATVHDLRMYDFLYDSAEKYYFSGIYKIIFPFYKIINEFFRPKFKKNSIKKCLEILDQVYTVSNFSLQRIISISPNAKVSVYYQGVSNNLAPVQTSVRENYILFVSGKRRLKNLIHALIGYLKYINLNPESELKLVITGIEKTKFECLCKHPKVNNVLIRNRVEIYEYVSFEKLAELYAKCRFHLYTSTAEGFGLPVLEAAYYGKVSLASNLTSIPEVLGAAAYYVYPTDDEGIARGIARLMDESILQMYENRVKEAFQIAKQRAQVEMCAMVKDLVGLNQNI